MKAQYCSHTENKIIDLVIYLLLNCHIFNLEFHYFFINNFPNTFIESLNVLA